MIENLHLNERIISSKKIQIFVNFNVHGFGRGKYPVITWLFAPKSVNMVRWLSLKGEFRQREREGRGGEGWKELRMKERRSVTAWTILCAKNAELSSSTVKLGLCLMKKQRATHKIIAMFLCFVFVFVLFFFHLHLLAWIHARQQLFYFGKLKKRSLGSCLVFTWLMHSNASLFDILPRKTPG